MTGTSLSSRSTVTSGTVMGVSDEFGSLEDDMYHVRIVRTRHFTVI